MLKPVVKEDLGAIFRLIEARQPKRLLPVLASVGSAENDALRGCCY